MPNQPRIYLDSEGATLSQGATVELVTEYHNLPIGAIGTVDIDSNPDDCVTFIYSQSHSRLYPHRLKLVNSSITPESEDDLIKRLTEAATKPGQFAMLNGTFYTVTLSPNQEANSALKPLVDSLALQIRRVRESAKVEIDREKAKIKVLITMPNISASMAKAGMRIYKRDNYLTYLLPMHYAPKKIVDKNNLTYCKDILEAHQKKLERDVFLSVTVSNDNRLISSSTLELDLTTNFDHYHGGNENCLGTVIKDPTLTTELTPAKVVELRDRYEKSLEAITHGDVLHGTPRGLPIFDRLLEFSTPSATPSAWIVPPSFPLGSLVKVKDSLGIPSTIIGTIGKVVHLDLSLRVGVEFCFRSPQLHDCDGHGRSGQCFYLLESDLEACPTATKRTSRLSPQAAPEEVEEPIESRPLQEGDTVSLTPSYQRVLQVTYSLDITTLPPTFPVLSCDLATNQLVITLGSYGRWILHLTDVVRVT
jgi:hypothetical protein